MLIIIGVNTYKYAKETLIYKNKPLKALNVII